MFDTNIITCVVWSVASLAVLLGCIGQLYSPKIGNRKAENVDLVIVSIASKGVETCLMDCIKHHKNIVSTMYVLVDEGAYLIPKLGGENLVVVPKSYRPDLVGKGRAMNYFIENHVDPTRWYGFIDDDNLVMDDKFLYEIPVYDALGYKAMNPLITARRGNSNFCYAMDFVRVFDCHMIYRFFTGLLGRPYLGMYGELLTVKGDALKDVGYDFRSVTEDFRFGSEFIRHGYRTWQSSTKISLRSANNIRDIMKQRGRWSKGVIMDWPYCTPLMKLITGVRLMGWCVGIFGTMLFLPAWFFLSFKVALAGGIYYWGIYIYAVFRTQKLRYVMAIPFFGIVEAMSFYAGLRQKKFVVIDKN